VWAVPIVTRAHFHGFPLRTRSAWRHLHCFSCQPLVRLGVEREALEAFFSWRGDGASVIELGYLPARGPVHEAFVDVTGERAAVTDAYTRAFLARAEDADTYLARVLSGDRRRRLRRLERNLGTAGPVRYAAPAGEGELTNWLDQFLALEARGWKGSAGSALASTREGARFFREIGLAAFRRGRLLMSGLYAGDAPIALFTGFLARDGVVAFKSAMDERYARHSPGVLLLLHVIERVHQSDPPMRWLDTSSAADSPLKQLFSERLPIHTLLLPAPHHPGAELVIAGLPLLKWARRQLRALSGPTSEE
jgi:hypothetical protein